MKLRELTRADMQEYNNLSSEVGTIFNTLEWGVIYQEKIQYYGIYNEGEKLIGGFSIYKEKKYGLSIYRNLPFTPGIGPFLKVEAQNPVSIMDTWKDVISIMAAFMENLPYSIISFSIDRHVIDTQPFIWKKFKVVPGYTYIMDLTLSIDDIWKRMSNDRRKNIKRGQNDSLTVEQINDFEIIKYLVLKTFSRQQKKTNEHYLDKILFKFATNENSFAFLTVKDKKPIACVFCIYDKNTAYYLLGGYDHEDKHHGAGALSMWEAIKYSKEKRLRYFDFEGSMVPRIERYFRGFGGQLTPYYRINKAKLPIEMLLKFFKRELF